MVDFNKLRKDKPDFEVNLRRGARSMTKTKTVLAPPPRIPGRVTPKIYTAQFGQVDREEADRFKPFHIYTITYSDRVKTEGAAYLSWLAPDWWLVAGHKRYNGDDDPRYQKFDMINDDQYRFEYARVLNERYSQHPQRFWDILNTDYPIVLQCFCAPGHFCHRHLCKDYLRAMAQSKGFYLIDGGELLDAMKEEQ